MDPQRWQEIRSTFDTIVDMDDVGRGTQLTALSTSDPELRAAVELLLAADSAADAELASLDAVFSSQLAPNSDLLGLAGRTVSHFEVREAIGAGGIGVVYSAEDTRLGRAVALKFLLPSYSLDAIAKTRFLREAHLVAALDHPNLCSIHDVGTSDDGRFFLAMPLYQGETLKARMARDGAIPVGDALEIVRQVGQGLQCAHEAGIVHRDLKPGNLMVLPDGTVKILDFGLAKARDQSVSETGARFGTVSYMSPEQIRGVPVDGRADLWAIGVVLYEMLTGRKPFDGEQDITIAHAILHAQPIPLSKVRDDLSVPLEDLVHRLLEKDPSRRCPSAKGFLAELTRLDIPQARVGRMRRRLRHAWGYAYRRAPSGRWVPIAIGAGIASVAIGAALVPSAKPATEPADRVQLTYTGNAIAPSLSADGKRVAFAEKLCDNAGYCTYQLLIQNTDGSGRRVLVRNIGYIYETQWIANDRFVEFGGSHPPLRQGGFAASTVGGEPRYLGCCNFDLASADTALIIDSDLMHRGWVRRISVLDGHALDSIPVRDQGTGYKPMATTIPDRLIVAARKREDSAPELQLIDFRGQIIDRVTPGFWLFDRTYGSRWVASGNKLVVASQRGLAGAEFDIIALNVTASGFGSEIDTVISRLPVYNGLFDISPDGERLTYSTGPVETSVSVIDVDRTTPGLLAATPVLSSTTFLRGRLSPNGDRILLARAAQRAGSQAWQFSFVPRSGGAETQIPGAVEDLLDFQWSPDGAGVMYLQAVGAHTIRLMETDAIGRATREIARREQTPGALSWNRGTAAVQFQPLPDGAVWIMAADRQSISVIGRPGKGDVTLRLPQWMRTIGPISHSADAKSLAVEGTNRSGDSIIVATADIESGRFNRLGTFAGSDPQRITWLDDGSIMFVLREKQGAFALHRLVPGRPVERLGVLPYTLAEFSVSNDGRHVAAFGSNDKNDVYMIRNFGEMLRR
jgi:hypothetical protein